MAHDHVRPSLAVMAMLILTVDKSRLTHSQHSVNKTFRGSCLPANATMAEINCKKKRGDLFSISDLKMAYGLVILESAIHDVETIWMNDKTGNPCQSTKDGTSMKTSVCCVATNSNGTNIFQTARCADQHHYVCSLNTASTEERNGTHLYSPCLNNSPSTDAAVIITGTCLTVTLVVVVIVWCYCRRARKPKRYAVRVESAIYHRRHPDADNDEGHIAADVPAIDNVNTESSDINLEQLMGAEGDDYDTLCRIRSTENNDVEDDQRSNVASVYSHLSGINSLGGWTIENHYDSTALPMYDRRPVDNLYARTYISDTQK